MIRRVAAVAGALLWLVMMASPAGADDCAPGCAGAAPTADRPVIVDVSGFLGPQGDQGVLSRSPRGTVAPALAVYVGLSAVGLTLAGITVRRMGLRRLAIELATGVSSVRSRAEFWDHEHRPAMIDGALIQPASAGSMMVGSGGGTRPTQHRPTVRAGQARGT
jgi:hypothetical protein